MRALIISKPDSLLQPGSQGGFAAQRCCCCCCCCGRGCIAACLAWIGWACRGAHAWLCAAQSTTFHAGPLPEWASPEVSLHALPQIMIIIRTVLNVSGHYPIEACTHGAPCYGEPSMQVVMSACICMAAELAALLGELEALGMSREDALSAVTRCVHVVHGAWAGCMSCARVCMCVCLCEGWEVGVGGAALAGMLPYTDDQIFVGCVWQCARAGSFARRHPPLSTVPKVTPAVDRPEGTPRC